MLLDVFLLITCIVAFYRGWKRGMLWSFCSLIAVLFGVVIGLKLSHVLANFFYMHNLLTSKYTLLICFILIFFSVVYSFRMVISLLETVMEKLTLGWVNNLAGSFLYMFFTVFLFSILCWLANEIHLISPLIKSTSFTYVYIEQVAPATLRFASDHLPACKDLYQEIKATLEKVAAS